MFVCLCLSAKFGKVDRGLRSWGSLSESRADEEQPVGGKRKVHPPLEGKETLPWPFNFADQQTPPEDPYTWHHPYPAGCEGHGRTAPPNLSPRMYNSWFPPASLKLLPSNKGTETWTDSHAVTLTATDSLQVYPFHCNVSLLQYDDQYSYCMHIKIYLCSCQSQAFSTHFPSQFTRWSKTWWAVTTRSHCQMDCRSARGI